MSGATATAVVAVAGAAAGYMGAREQNKAAKKAAKAASQPRTSYTTRTPYMNEYISQLAPYLLQEAQNVYSTRSRGYGRNVGDFSQIAQRLTQIPHSYTGVGGPAGGAQGVGMPSTEDRLASDWATRMRRDAWQRNMPTDAGMGSDQVQGPDRAEGLVGATMGSGSEVDQFRARDMYNANPWRERNDRLDAERDAVMNDDPTANFRGTGYTPQQLREMAQNAVPRWLRRRNRNQAQVPPINTRVR